MDNLHQLSAQLREEFAALYRKLQAMSGLQASDLKLMQSWLDQLQHSCFGRALVHAKQMNGGWVECMQAGKDSLLLNEVSCLADMRLRFETVKDVLERYLFQGMTAGIFPSNYIQEWDSFKRDGVFTVGIQNTGELILRSAEFDVLLHSNFLYGDEACDALDFGYLYAGLKPGGVLITSNWTLPETSSLADDSLDDAFFKTLLGMKKCPYRSVADVKKELRQAGFDQILSLNSGSERIRSLLAKKPDSVMSPQKYKRQVSHTPRRATKKGFCFNSQILAF